MPESFKGQETREEENISMLEKSSLFQVCVCVKYLVGTIYVLHTQIHIPERKRSHTSYSQVSHDLIRKRDTIKHNVFNKPCFYMNKELYEHKNRCLINYCTGIKSWLCQVLND